MQQASLASLFREATPVSTTVAANSLAVKEAVYWARFEGAQIRIDGQTVYQGATFPTDSNSADSFLAEIWKAWGEPFIERIGALVSPGSIISILAYKGDNWAPVKSLPLL
jgi:hypothetical protein